MLEKNFFTTAHKLADIAGKISKQYFRNQIGASFKDNASLVTEADLRIEEALSEYIHNTYPTHSILGEEYGLTQKQSDYVWVIDPIDGTTSFMCGKPTYTTLIALLYQNCPILSIIDQPIMSERWLGATDQITELNGHPCIQQPYDVNLLRLNCTTPDMFSQKQKEIFTAVEKKAQVTCYGGDGYAYGLMASGYIDIIMEADLQYYDVAALIPIIEGMGGVITDWQGNLINQETFDGTILATRHPEIYALMLNLM